MPTKYTKGQQNVTKGDKIDEMTIFYCKTVQNLPKIGNFVLKIYHLATLLHTSAGLPFSFILHIVSISVTFFRVPAFADIRS
jgi:hypothetical protein